MKNKTTPIFSSWGTSDEAQVAIMENIIGWGADEIGAREGAITWTVQVSQDTWSTLLQSIEPLWGRDGFPKKATFSGKWEQNTAGKKGKRKEHSGRQVVREIPS